MLCTDDEYPSSIKPRILKREGKSLVIRLVQDSENSILLMEEQRNNLEPLGLTSREAEVLRWVAMGKTDAEIGTILGLSPRTVQKHLELIYKKLGVENRTAAAAKAYEMASVTRT